MLLPLLNPDSPLNGNHRLNRNLIMRLKCMPNNQWSRSFNWFDLCKRNNAVVAASPNWIGPFGRQGGWGAYSCNGSTNHLTCANDPTLNISGPITLSAWMRPSAVATQYIIKKAVISATNGYELSLSTGNKLFFRLNQVASADTYRINSTTNYPTGSWFHGCVTYDGSNLRLYMNGISDATAVAGPASITTNSLALGIGAQPDGTTKYSGIFDDLCIWNRALSANEVSLLYATTKLKYDPTVNWINSISPRQLNRYTLTASAGSYSESGTAATLKIARILSASAGSYSESGTAATPIASRKISAAGSSYSETGTAATLKATRSLTCNSASVSVTGTSVSFRYDRILTASGGSISLSGQSASLRLAREGISDGGSVAVGASAASLKCSRKLTASGGSASISGQSIGFGLLRGIFTDSYAVNVTGSASLLGVHHKLFASGETITVLGSNTDLFIERLIATSIGQYEVADGGTEFIYDQNSFAAIIYYNMMIGEEHCV